jgi:hypothetical protein
VLVGLEARGYSCWFERLLAELGIEVWTGNAAEIKTKRVRKQKTDRQDAKLSWVQHGEASMPDKRGIAHVDLKFPISQTGQMESAKALIWVGRY